MRSLLLTLVLGLGAAGLSLAMPNQARADDGRNPEIRDGTTMPVAYWRGGVRWGRGFYPGYGYGFNRGYYPYGYGLYGNYGGYRSYYPGYWGGYGGYYRPYGGFYRRGFYW